MRWLKLAVAVLSAASMVACATINNPLSSGDILAAENAYGIALSAAVAYRHLPLCKTGTVESVGNVCARRSVILQLQSADTKARAAIGAAAAFVKNNPTLDATTLIQTAYTAISALQAIETAHQIK